MFRNYKSLQNKLWKAEADSRGRRGWGGCPPPIDWMHFKTSKNYAPKCMIFA